MAKKIRLDFSKVEERSGYNSKHIPEGLYEMKIVGVDQTEAQDSTAMLVYTLVPTDSRFKSRRFPYYCKLQQNQLWKLRDLLVAAGVSVPKKALSIDPDSPIGKLVAAEVQDGTGNFSNRSEVSGIYGTDILDDVDGSEPDDEEEYDEDEADEVDESEDEEYDEDDEEEDDLDEEDLEEDDEDYEEEEDEEEEEPAPAPRRRAAPAKKPAAKAAPAAPARRSVRRR